MTVRRSRWTAGNTAVVPAIVGGFPESADQGEGNADAGLTVSGTLTVRDLDVTDVVTAKVESVKVNGVDAGIADVGTEAGDPVQDITNATLLSFLKLSDADNDGDGPDAATGPLASIEILSKGETLDTLNWTFDSGTEAFDYLADGETLELEYTVSLTDDSGVTANNSDIQTIKITITGTNDRPEITVESGNTAVVPAIVGGFPESADQGEGNADAGLTVSGTLTVRDLDVTDVVTAKVESVKVNGVDAGIADVGTEAGDPVQDITNATLLSFLKLSDADNDGDGPDAATGPLASIEILSEGETLDTLNWTFDSGTEAFDYLADGETLELEYTVSLTDDSGVTANNSDIQTIKITITGTNDRPEITVESGNTAVVPAIVGGFPESADQGEGNADAGLTVSGTLTVRDLDVTDVVTAKVESVKVNGVDAGIADVGTEAGDPVQDITNATLLSFLKLSDADNDGDGPDAATGPLASIEILSEGETLDTLNWTFDSGTEAFDYLADGETLELEYTVSLTDDSGVTANNSDIQTIKITITGTNDRPEITVESGNTAVVPAIVGGFPKSADQGEGNADAGLTVSGTLTVRDLDVTDVVTAKVESVKVNGVDAGIADVGTEAGDPVQDITNATLLSFLKLSDADNDGDGPDAATGPLASIEILSEGETLDTLNWTFDSGTEAFDYLADGETLELEYTVSLTDDSGVTANNSDIQTIKITITGTNDRPEITVESGNTAVVPAIVGGFPKSADQGEGNADAGLTVSGTLTVRDLDVTDVVTAKVESVKVNGVDAGIADVGTEAGDPVQDITNATLLSFLKLSDADNDGDGPDAATGPLASIEILSEGETLDTLNWTFNSGTEAFDYLADGETLELEYTVSLTDDSGVTANNSDIQTIKITITGTNDRPEITVESGNTAVVPAIVGGFPESADQGEGNADAGLTVSGTLTVRDLDVTDVVTAKVESVKVNGVDAGIADVGTEAGDPVQDITNATLLSFLKLSDADNDGDGPDAATGPLASIEILSEGETLDTLNWTFDSGTEAFDYLADGETLELEYTVSLTDDSGVTANNSDIQTIKITITGTNDVPVIETANTNAVGGFYETIGTPEAEAEPLTAMGSIAFSDVDVTDANTVPLNGIVLKSVNGSILQADLDLAVGTLTASVYGDTDATTAGTIDWEYLLIRRMWNTWQRIRPSNSSTQSQLTTTMAAPTARTSPLPSPARMMRRLPLTIFFSLIQSSILPS